MTRKEDNIMTAQNKKNLGKHLSISDRKFIERSIEQRRSKVDIARDLGKDKSTIAKEIEKHRVKKDSKLNYKSQCSNFKTCRRLLKCTRACHDGTCEDFKPFYCKFRNRTPCACNGCSTSRSCHFTKFYYHADHAEHEYQDTLVHSRDGVNLTTLEGKEMGELVAKLIKQGHSPYAIINQHPELEISVKTLYNYIDSHVFEFVGIQNIDLPKKVGRKLSKKKTCENYRKRKNNKYLQNRTYEDFLAYCEQLCVSEGTQIASGIVQMDTVYNDVTNGPFMQTFKFLDTRFFFAVLHEKKTAQAMVQGVDLLEEILGKELFEKFCRVILTDRGSEFSDAEGFEKRKDGTQRTKVFYCDPMQSGQKGSLENEHILLRRICPKERDLQALGLTSQKAMNTVLSHINSYPVKDLHGKTPFQNTKFLLKELSEAMQRFGITEISSDEVILKPILLHDFRSEK